MKKFKYGKYIINVNDYDNLSDSEIKSKIKDAIKVMKDEEDKLKYQLFVKLSEDKEEDFNFYGKYDTLETAVKKAEKDESIVSYQVKDLNNKVLKTGGKTIKDEAVYRWMAFYDDVEDAPKIEKAKELDFYIKKMNDNFCFIEAPLSKMVELFDIDANEIEEASKQRMSTIKKITDSLRDAEPKKGETEEEFISRFMKSQKEEYPDVKQRYAVAKSYWNRRDSVEDSDKLENILQSLSDKANDFTKSMTNEEEKNLYKDLYKLTEDVISQVESEIKASKNENHNPAKEALSNKLLNISNDLENYANKAKNKSAFYKLIALSKELYRAYDRNRKFKKEIVKDSEWKAYTLSKGQLAEEFKEYLRDRGIYFEPSEDGNYVHFEVKNPDKDVDAQITAMKKHYFKLNDALPKEAYKIYSFYDISEASAELYNDVYNYLALPVDDENIIHQDVLDDSDLVKKLYETLRQAVISELNQNEFVFDTDYDKHYGKHEGTEKVLDLFDIHKKTTFDSVKDSKYIYLYAKSDITPEDERMMRRYGLQVLGTNHFNEEVNLAVKGELEMLKKFNEEYMAYEMHPDYLYKEDEFAGDIEPYVK